MPEVIEVEESGDEASEVPEAAEQLQRLPGGQEFTKPLTTSVREIKNDAREPDAEGTQPCAAR